MKVRIDADRCTGHGRCYSLSPDVFEADEQGHGVVRFEVVPPELEAAAHSAVNNCPEQAIAIIN